MLDDEVNVIVDRTDVLPLTVVPVALELVPIDAELVAVFAAVKLAVVEAVEPVLFVVSDTEEPIEIVELVEGAVSRTELACRQNSEWVSECKEARGKSHVEKQKAGSKSEQVKVVSAATVS